jgi:repressor LexA
MLFLRRNGITKEAHMKASLSTKQEAVLFFVKGFIAKHRIAPTYEEICKAFSWRSTRAAANHVKALERKGYLKRHDSGPRSLQVVEDH